MVVKIRHFIKQSWLLIVVSFWFGLLIAGTNYALSGKIRQNKINKLNRLASLLLPQARDFVPLESEIEVKSMRGKKEKLTLYKAQSACGAGVGWSFAASGPGFADKIELVIGVDKDFRKLAGFHVLASNETPGFGDRIRYGYYRDQFKGAPVGQLKLVRTGDPKKIDSEVVAISGATVSSEAVVEIINHYVLQVKKQLQREGLLADDKR